MKKIFILLGVIIIVGHVVGLYINQANGLTEAMQDHLEAPGTKISVQEAIRYQNYGAVAMPSKEWLTIENLKKVMKFKKEYL